MGRWGAEGQGKGLVGSADCWASSPREQKSHHSSGSRAESYFRFSFSFFLKENEAQMAERNAGDHWHNDLPVVG